MSVIPISIQSLANVRRALSHSFAWREDSDLTPLCLFGAFLPVASRFSITRQRASTAATDFVNLAFIFNAEEYHKGRYAKINAEPVEYGCALAALQRTKGAQLGRVQLLKTLQFIQYNTSVRGWLNEEEFSRWCRHDEYISFHKQLDAIIRALLVDIVSNTEEYKAATWG